MKNDISVALNFIWGMGTGAAPERGVKTWAARCRNSLIRGGPSADLWGDFAINSFFLPRRRPTQGRSVYRCSLLVSGPGHGGGGGGGVNSNLPTAERGRLRGQIRFDRVLRRRRFHRKAGGRHLFLFRADGSGFYVCTNENCPIENNKDANFRGKFPRQHFCLGARELRVRSPRTHTHAEGWSGGARGALPLSSAFSCSACPRFRLIPRSDSIFMVRLVAFGCVLESAVAR